jgi:methyl-accepting chemotaxis protein
MTPNTETILIVFVAFTGLAVLLQALILLAIFISLRKTAKSVLEATEDLKVTVVPMVHSTRELVQRITPQIITVSEGLAEFTDKMKRESASVNISVSEVAQRVSRQMQRLDAMLTTSLNAVEKATDVVETAVSAPVRQVNGILAAIRAVIDTYRAETPLRRTNHADADGPRMHQ